MDHEPRRIPYAATFFNNLISLRRKQCTHYTSMQAAWATKHTFSFHHVPITAGWQRYCGKRSLLDTSTHDRQWEPNLLVSSLSPYPHGQLIFLQYLRYSKHESLEGHMHAWVPHEPGTLLKVIHNHWQDHCNITI